MGSFRYTVLFVGGDFFFFLGKRGFCAMKPLYYMRKTERKYSRNRKKYVLVLLVEIKRHVLIRSISHKKILFT